MVGAGWWGKMASFEALAARPMGASNKAGTGAMPPSLSIWLDHLIPADALSPSASALKVPQSMWALARQDADHVKLLRFGCDWLDRYHPDGLAGLSEDERDKLAQWMSQAPWESPQRRFFDLVRDQARALYYQHPQARQGTLLVNPPQPMGRSIDLPAMHNEVPHV
jgi:hypothetical protein